MIVFHLDSYPSFLSEIVHGLVSPWHPVLPTRALLELPNGFLLVLPPLFLSLEKHRHLKMQLELGPSPAQHT